MIVPCAILAGILDMLCAQEPRTGGGAVLPESPASRAAPRPPADEPFPGLEPFSAAPRAVDPGREVLSARKAREFLAAERAVTPSSEDAPDVASRPAGALLGPEVPARRVQAYLLAPVIVALARELWRDADWSADDRALADEIGRYLESVFAGPRLAITQDYAANQKELERVGQWFLRATQTPLTFARMIASVDDGPFTGAPAGSVAGAKETLVVPIGERLRLAVLSEDRGDEPVLLQIQSGTKVLWTRRVSGRPFGFVTSVAVDEHYPLKDPAERLEPYGWNVHLRAERTSGSGPMCVYLDPDGGLLFYFLGMDREPDSRPARPVAERGPFPTLEPFGGEELTSAVTTIFAPHRKALVYLARTQLVTAGLWEDPRDPPASRPQGARLTGEPSGARRSSDAIPFLLEIARLLWLRREWSHDDRVVAQRLGRVLESFPGAPLLSFPELDAAANRKELEKFAAWFASETAKPASFASMLFTLDDGPYAGFPVPRVGLEEVEEVGTIPLGRSSGSRSSGSR